MTQHEDWVRPPENIHGQSAGEEWISPRDHDFRMQVSNSLTNILGRLGAIETQMETAKTDRRWLIGMVITGMVASAGVLSLISQLLQNGG